jgi:hypothetical protein
VQVAGFDERRIDETNRTYSDMTGASALSVRAIRVSPYFAIAAPRRDTEGAGQR